MAIYRGYNGYYNGIYLRSSLEFSFAYFLDYKNIKWKYEITTFPLKDGAIYKPDFYIYDDEGDLLEIIEIKGIENRAKGEERLALFKDEYKDYIISIIDYRDLLIMYRKFMPISLNKSKKIFIEEYNATLDLDYSKKENNPMYNVKHKESTKIKIGQKAKLRFQNEEYMSKFKESLKYRKVGRGYIKSKREVRICPTCGEGFEVTIYSKRKYCSPKCVRTQSKACEGSAKKHKKVRDAIKDFIIEWVSENRELVRNTQYNKITTNLKELFDLIESNFGIKDMRTISLSFGTTSRKELLKMLKEI